MYLTLDEMNYVIENNNLSKLSAEFVKIFTNAVLDRLDNINIYVPPKNNCYIEDRSLGNLYHCHGCTNVKLEIGREFVVDDKFLNTKKTIEREWRNMHIKIIDEPIIIQQPIIDRKTNEETFKEFQSLFLNEPKPKRKRKSTKD